MSYELTRGSIRLAGIRAKKGGMEEQIFLSSAFIDFRESINRSLKGLEKGNYTYSHAYRFMSQFLINEFEDAQYVPTLNEMNNDWQAIARTLSHMVKFKTFKDSTPERMREIEKRRLETIRSWEFMPDDISDRRLKNFLRFLSSEETKQLIDLYGNSEEIIEVIYEAYTKRSNSKIKMKRAFMEFMNEYNNDPYHNVDINSAFEKLGIRRYL